MRLPPEVVLSIHRILDDAQDTPDALGTLEGDFDPVATLNELIPNGLPVAMFRACRHLPFMYVEEALEQLDAIQDKLQSDRVAIQDELDVLFDELQKSQDADRMQIIQELISVRESPSFHALMLRYFPYVTQELLSQLNRIREKASESEAIVREITKDIQILDLAKKNILQSVTTLKRFQMLGMPCLSTHSRIAVC